MIAVNECMYEYEWNEWTEDRMKRMKEWTHEMKSNNGWMKGWNEWANEGMNEGMNVWMHGWMNQRMKGMVMNWTRCMKPMNACNSMKWNDMKWMKWNEMTEWMNEWMNEGWN